ncbi:MAG: hypothetical protein H0Z19_10705 [Archaeoglobus sp.]|uniref:hypothetical protein n=1 Tax=Archaeoglobus sp. TaxID=1872626 RepID=UPI001DDB8038|nr:hypothetical protein [Archaeoglobus sp.]MBO8180922.1 hypothetical protein [Archaeoglobus sp.]
MDGFILKHFPIVAYILMTSEEFTISELMSVFSHRTVYSFLNRGMSIGAIEKIEKGRFRLKFSPQQVMLAKQLDHTKVEAERILVRNGCTLMIV